MTESERITALETKVESLENRMTKLETSDDNKAIAYSSIDTKLQLLGQKFDSFVESLDEKKNTKKFNWTQILVILGILVAMGTTVWSTNYTIKQTLETNTTSEVYFSNQDLEKITQSVLSEMKKDNK